MLVLVAISEYARPGRSATNNHRGVGMDCLSEPYANLFDCCDAHCWLFYAIFIWLSVSEIVWHLVVNCFIVLVNFLFSKYYFRRDRGFTNTTYPHPPPLLFATTQEKTVYYGESIFVYGIASVIHFSAFLAAIYVFRIAESEQLQSLVERVFILCNIPNKIFYILWFHIACGFLWLITMTTYIVVMEQDQVAMIAVNWFGKPTFILLEVAKVGARPRRTVCEMKKFTRNE